MGARTAYQVRDVLYPIPSAASAGAEPEGRSRVGLLKPLFKYTMSTINSYATDNSVSYNDKLIGTDAEDSNKTKNFTVGSILAMPLPSVPVYADNSAALAGGLVVGNVYRITGTDQLGVVH